MPLLQDRVQVKLVPNVIKHYEKCGYDLPRYKDKRGRIKIKKNTQIIVDLEDLPDGCGIPIYMACDNCGKTFYRHWREHKEHEGKIYCRKCAGLLRRGDKAYNWNPLLSADDRIRGRDYQEYHDFISRVLSRDDYTCKVCGEKRTSILVHHINGYNWCVEERTLDNNGITLCDVCHNKFHSIYGRGSNTKEQFEEWIGSPIGTLGKGILPPARKVICMDDGNIIENAPKAAKQYGIDRNSLYLVLNQTYRSIHKQHFLWYDDYEKMSKEDVSKYWRWVINKNPMQ